MLKYKYVKSINIFDDVIRNTTIQRLIKYSNNKGLNKNELIRIIMSEALKKLDEMIKEV